MNNYQSVLFKILQIIYEDVKLVDNHISLSSQLKNIISDMYDLPKYFLNFLGCLLDGIKLQDFDDVLSKSITSSLRSNCKKCVDCKKCTSLFYIALAEKFINVENGFDNKIIDKWFSKKEELINLYGEFNFSPIPPYISRHFVLNESVYEFQKKQKKYINETKDIMNSIIMLKGMSSSSPYLYNSIFENEHFTGGGVYINYNNIGIAIDPGYGFIENMNKNKIFIDDIDIVIITHFHIDHTNDIRLIDDLNRSINYGIKDFENINDYNEYKFGWKEKLKQEGKKPHIIKWYVDTHTNENLMRDFNLLINDIHTIETSSFNEPIEIFNGILMNPFHSKHIQYNYYKDTKIKSNYKDNTFGFTLYFEDFDKKIGYTSDTAYTPELSNWLKDSNCIIANISGIYEDDYLSIKQKDRHLGYSGCKKLLNSTDASLFIISEFWNGISDLRFDVCKSLSKECGRKVIPGEIGLQVSLKDCSVRCTICGNYSCMESIRTIAPVGEMKKIVFSCDNCRF